MQRKFLIVCNKTLLVFYLRPAIQHNTWNTTNCNDHDVRNNSNADADDDDDDDCRKYLTGGQTVSPAMQNFTCCFFCCTDPCLR